MFATRSKSKISSCLFVRAPKRFLQQLPPETGISKALSIRGREYPVKKEACCSRVEIDELKERLRLLIPKVEDNETQLITMSAWVRRS